MTKLSKIILTGYMMAILAATAGHAYDNEVAHQAINGAAAKQSNLDAILKSNLSIQEGLGYLLTKDGDTKTIERWLKEGGKLEDVPNCRSKYHFHDPTKTFDAAGLSNSAINTLCANWSNYPSITWAQHQNNEWSWQKARNYFYLALTSTTSMDRETNFAKTFQAVGQVMHLLADKSVPEHVRNDIHILPFFDNPNKSFPEMGSWTYETWSKWNALSLNTTAAAVDPTIINTPVASGIIPISNFWDTTPGPGYGSTIGLAEYTNYNFLSTDTTFKNYTYPAKPMHRFERFRAEDGQYDYRVYFSGTTSDSMPINHLASTGYLWAELENISPLSMDTAKFNLDDNCFKDYASILVPKAVGYSAGLLNYFFRGEIEVTLPNNGVYAITDPNGSFNKIQLKVRNVTQTGEEMTNGTIQLVVKYKIAQEDPFRSDLTEPVDTSEDFTYAVAAASSNTIPRNSPVELTFDFSQNPIPLWATDVYLQVVYRGQLGNEQDAVAVGFKDTSEPTPFDVINNADYTCINGTYYQSGSDEAINLGHELNAMYGLDVFPHELTNVYLALSSAPTPTYAPPLASSTHYTAHFPQIPPGGYGRIFILTDYDFGHSVQATRLKISDRDPSIIEYDVLTGVSPAEGMENQTNYEQGIIYVDGNPVTVWGDFTTYSILLNYRGFDTWWYHAINNYEYHISGDVPDAVCPQSNTLPAMSGGPVPVTIP